MTTYLLRFPIFALLSVLWLTPGAAVQAQISDGLKEYLDANWPDPGLELIAYSPPEAVATGSWRADYDRGLMQFRDGRFNGAAGSFTRALASVPEQRLSARALCQFALGTSFLMAGQDITRALYNLRYAVGAVRQRYRQDDRSMQSWYAVEVEDSQSSGLYTYHIYSNLIVTYLRIGRHFNPERMGAPWQNEVLREPNYFSELASPPPFHPPHAKWLRHHQNDRTAPGQLVYANSNLERLAQDPANFSHSLLLSQNSVIVLEQLGDRENSLAVLKHIVPNPPGEDARLSMFPLAGLGKTIDRDELLARVTKSTFARLLMAGDLDSARIIANGNADLKEKAASVLLAVEADSVFEQLANSPQDNRIISRARDLAGRVLDDPALAWMKQDAQEILAIPEEPKCDATPDHPCQPKPYSFSDISEYVLIVVFALLLFLAWCWLRFSHWNNDVYYWRLYNSPGCRPDFDAPNRTSSSIPDFQRPES